ncbi:MAG: VOC family protein [Porticoccaceae bacterium]
MSFVTELGYIGLGVSDLDAWRKFATDVVGMEWVDENEEDRCYLRLDDWHHRVVLHANGADDLAYVGWRVADEPSLELLKKKLDENSIQYHACSKEEADERYVMGMIKLTSPGGIETEIFWGPQIEGHKPFHPGRRMFGKFRSGNLGLGHIALRENDGRGAYEFYRLLGLKGNTQYKLRLPNDMVVRPFFMHCNQRQHTVQFDLGPMEKRVNHLAIEYMDIKDLGLARDIVRTKKLDVPLDLGMHSNDQALSFYVGNPSGWVWELAWNSRQPPNQDEYYTWDIFGHEVGSKGYGLDLDTTNAGRHIREQDCK